MVLIHWGKIPVYLSVFSSALLDLRRDGEVGHLCLGAEARGGGADSSERKQSWAYGPGGPIDSHHVPSALSFTAMEALRACYVRASTCDTAHQWRGQDAQLPGQRPTPGSWPISA